MNLHEDDIQRLHEQRKYTEATFDKQLVYLSGGGLILTLGFVKEVIDLANCNFLFLLLGSWISFTLTLTFNLISHLTGKKYIDNYLSSEKIKGDWWSMLTSQLNFLCTFLFLLGVTLFIIFTFLNI